MESRLTRKKYLNANRTVAVLPTDGSVLPLEVHGQHSLVSRATLPRRSLTTMAVKRSVPAATGRWRMMITVRKESVMEIIELGSVAADTKVTVFSGEQDSIPQPNKDPSPV